MSNSEDEHEHDGTVLVGRLQHAFPEVPFFDPPVVPAQSSEVGGSSEIFKARLVIDGNSRLIALKRLRANRTGRPHDEDELYERMARELSIWGRLHHPNVLLLLGLCNEGSPESPAFVMSWMPNSTLDMYIKATPGFTVRPVLDGIAEGLAYLHSRNIVHRDLKANNILMDRNNQPHISDFGMSYDLNSRDTFRPENYRIGNPRWTPPEYLRPRKFGLPQEDVISKAADMYSLGMTIYEISSTNIPYFDFPDLYAIAKAVTEGVRPSFPEETASKRALSAELWSFAQACWKESRAERPTITDLLRLLYPRPLISLTTFEPETLPQQEDKVSKEEIIVSATSSAGKSWYDELWRDLLSNIFLPLLTRRPSAEQREQRDRLAEFRERAAAAIAQVDKWIDCSPGLHSAGATAKKSLQGVLKESRSPPSRWFRRRRVRTERLAGALARWNRTLEEILEGFYRNIVRTLLESSEKDNLELVRQAQLLSPLRAIIEKAPSSERLKVQELAESLLRLLHSGRGRSIEGRDSAYMGLAVMLPHGAVPPRSASLEGLKSDSKPRWVSRRFEVCEGHWEGQIVAVKWIRKRSFLQTADYTEKVLVETAPWRQLGHPNVLPFYGVHSGSYMQENAVALVSMWAIRGSITCVLEEAPSMDRRPMVMDIAHGLAYLHRRGLVHANMKATNILIDVDGSAMLSDWRLPQDTDVAAEEDLKETSPGEPSEDIRWSAPELGTTTGRPTPASDVFSFARTILEIMTGEIPFLGTSTTELQELFARGELLPHKPDHSAAIARGLTDELWELLVAMWDRSPDERPALHVVEQRLAGIFGERAASVT